MKKLILFSMILSMCATRVSSQNKNTTSGAVPDTLPVRGLSIAAPTPAGVDAFLEFIKNELAPRQINTLILRVDYNYQWDSHPELRDTVALSKSEIKKIAAACKKANIRIVPQINLFVHQSWTSTLGKLLAVYPQFDETPSVKIPEKYVWPNADGLYCKSYCPLHPDLHKVVFALMDEICDVFEADAFHAGMDEVFYIADSKCPRCSGHDPAEIYAGEVSKLRNHLAEKGRQLWIWGDRLIDGKTTGMGMWEASMNNTHRAIDLIPKDVVICDWHYERPDQTAVYFAAKGLNVITCPWRKPDVAMQQMADMYQFRKNSTPEMKSRFQGIIETTWAPAEFVIEEFYRKDSKKDPKGFSVPDTFKGLFPKQ